MTNASRLCKECIDPYLMNIGPTCNSNWNHHSTPNSNQPVVSSLLIISIRSLTVPSWSKLRMYNIRLRKDFPRANCRMRRLASVDMKNQHYPKSINKKRHAMNRRSQWRLAPSCKALLPSLRMFPDSPEKFLHQNPLPRNLGQSLKSIPPRKLPKVPGVKHEFYGVISCPRTPSESLRSVLVYPTMWGNAMTIKQRHRWVVSSLLPDTPPVAAAYSRIDHLTSGFLGCGFYIILREWCGLPVIKRGVHENSWKSKKIPPKNGFHLDGNIIKAQLRDSLKPHWMTPDPPGRPRHKVVGALGRLLGTSTGSFNCCTGLAVNEPQRNWNHQFIWLVDDCTNNGGDHFWS